MQERGAYEWARVYEANVVPQEAWRVSVHVVVHQRCAVRSGQRHRALSCCTWMGWVGSSCGFSAKSIWLIAAIPSPIQGGPAAPAPHADGVVEYLSCLMAADPAAPLPSYSGGLRHPGNSDTDLAGTNILAVRNSGTMPRRLALLFLVSITCP